MVHVACRRGFQKTWRREKAVGVGGTRHSLFSTEKLDIIGVCVTLSLYAGCELTVWEGTLGPQVWPNDSKTHKSFPMPRAKLATLGDLRSRKAKREMRSGSLTPHIARSQRCANRYAHSCRGGFPAHAAHPEPRRNLSWWNRYCFSFPLSSEKRK